MDVMYTCTCTYKTTYMYMYIQNYLHVYIHVHVHVQYASKSYHTVEINRRINGPALTVV